MKDIYGEEVIVKPPNISEETKLRMVEFFMKTSIPRILVDYKAGQVKKKEGDVSDDGE